MTALTDEGFSKVKKAKPRERPVSESRMIVQCVIGPNCSKYDLSESASGTSVVSDEGGASRRGGRAVWRTVGGVPVQAADEHLAAELEKRCKRAANGRKSCERCRKTARGDEE